MSGTLERLKKLRGRSARELRVRSGQALSVLAEKGGWSRLTHLPDDQEFRSLLSIQVKDPATLLDHLRTETSKHFFASFTDPKATISALKSQLGETWSSAIIERADRIVAGRFHLLGLRDLNFGTPIDWHFEPTLAKRSPRVHWSDVNYLDVETSGDKKVTWELNRHQYFLILGQAYWLTADEKYAQTFTSHLESWLDDNPPKLGINWASSLEIAFRSISWLWAFQFFKNSPALSGELYVRSLKVLYLNALHLEQYPSTYFSPNTHLTGEALGLFYLGTLLREFKAANRWRDLGSQILLEQLPLHVKDDGVYFELSSYYHRYTADFYLHYLILSSLNGNEPSSLVADKLNQLLDYLMYITRPDGTSPLLGDDDGGRLVLLDNRASNDFSAPLATGAALFQRGDYKFVANEVAEETLWLLGPRGLADFDSVTAHEPTHDSVEFGNSGYYSMRDAWTNQANYLLFDCGPHGAGNSVHAHADSLSIELVANGRILLVDPGTFTYTGSKELRDWFRSSAAHNTMSVDGESSSVPGNTFSWKTSIAAEKKNWIAQQRFNYVAATQPGFARLTSPGIHSRSLLFLKNDYWVMQDRLKGSEPHQVDLWFHFAPDASPQLESPINGKPRLFEKDLKIVSFAKEGFWQQEEGSVSHCYAQRIPASVFRFSVKADQADVVTLLLPSTATDETPASRELESVGGRSFELVSVSRQDVVMMKRGARVETANFVSDFELAWLRFSTDNTLLPEELILIEGHRLELHGRAIISSNRRINYLVAVRVGEQFRVETDEGILDLSFPIEDLESMFAASAEVQGSSN